MFPFMFTIEEKILLEQEKNIMREDNYFIAKI